MEIAEEPKGHDNEGTSINEVTLIAVSHYSFDLARPMLLISEKKLPKGKKSNVDREWGTILFL